MALVGPLANRVASCWRVSSSSARGTTRFTRPSRYASAAGTSSPKKNSSLAFWMPTRRASSHAPPPSGAMPRRTKISMNFDSSAATTRSQASARCMPPPAAVPLTPAMTGFSQSRMEPTSRCQPLRMVLAPSPTTVSGAPSGRGRRAARPPRRSAPVQNALSPAPVMTTTRTSRSADASWTHSPIWSRMALVIAFPASGRLSVIRATPSSNMPEHVVAGRCLGGARHGRSSSSVCQHEGEGQVSRPNLYNPSHRYGTGRGVRPIGPRSDGHCRGQVVRHSASQIDCA